VKQAIKFAAEIIRKKNAVLKTKSKSLKADYMKNVNDSEKELREYCRYKCLDYDEIMVKAMTA
jgi:hypothetical protein